jgi:restriction system protein
MTIPKYDEIMKPMLRRLADGNVLKVDGLVPVLADEFGLTKDELNEKTAGGEALFKQRVWWARTYLGQAAAVTAPEPGYVSITDRGREILEDDPPVIKTAYLMRRRFHVLCGQAHSSRLGCSFTESSLRASLGRWFAIQLRIGTPLG